jgi:hypothetical protein
MSKKLFILFVNAILLLALAACNLVDNGIKSGINKGFGNDPTCSGIVCR